MSLQNISAERLLEDNTLLLEKVEKAEYIEINYLPRAIANIAEQVDMSNDMTAQEKVAANLKIFRSGAVIAGNFLTKPSAYIESKPLALELYRLYTEQANNLAVAKVNFK